MSAGGCDFEGSLGKGLPTDVAQTFFRCSKARADGICALFLVEGRSIDFGKDLLAG